MAKQLLHLVFGGELTDPAGVEFVDPYKLDIVGMFPNYSEAYKAWRGAAAKSVDSANTRYFIVHLHRMIDPQTDTTREQRGEAGKHDDHDHDHDD